MARPVKIITDEGYWGRHRLTKITELQPSIFSVFACLFRCLFVLGFSCLSYFPRVAAHKSIFLRRTINTTPLLFLPKLS